ncbi:hypothetical protein M409DRAFT_21873 [Zasmidium cellare ATCC 36951]|uniref:Uncharacterized protein n=1 Tax=Zasmidium cellare ATCC 36951 TaxID=1080233 RepID=A0A6A6CKZ9_ZASCE|nr:uncharacterized protein M409DRAFT_21873 [Zasmidium cellare ATCC 36951]KAF2167721.1 hypothetical protein M409DRAFT_21873 [Zasmidium cellare ATCC 36951]
MAASKRIEAELSDGLFKTHGELINLLDAAYTVRNAKLFNQVGKRLILDATSAIPSAHPRISHVLRTIEQVRLDVLNHVANFIERTYQSNAHLHQPDRPNQCRPFCRYHQWYEQAFRNYLTTCGLWPVDNPVPCSLRTVLNRMTRVEFDSLDVDKRWICERNEGDVWKSKCCVGSRTKPTRLNALFTHGAHLATTRIPQLCLDCALKGEKVIKTANCGH